MGKKGKNKGGGTAPPASGEPAAPQKAEEKPTEIPPKVEVQAKVEIAPKVEVKAKVEIAPKVEVVAKVEAPKVENKKVVPENKKVEQSSTADKESETKTDDDTIKKKKRNRNKKKTLDVNVANETISPPQNTEQNIKKDEVKENCDINENAPETGTIKKKKNKKKKPNKTNNEADQKIEEELKKFETALVDNKTEEQNTECPTADSNTLKKKKRNRNKKNKTNSEVTEEKTEEKVEEKESTPTADAGEGEGEFKVEVNKKRRGKKRDNTSKMCILDELKIKQAQEEKEARETLQKEIETREKLLEKIEQVLDTRKVEIKQSQQQQNILGNLSKDLSDIEGKVAQVAQDGKSQLTSKVQQVLDVTKMEIANVKNQQAYVGVLENELAKVKDTKEKLIKGETASTSSSEVKLPEHIEKMKSEIKDVKKVAAKGKKRKEELLKEIENRDKLMAEIGKVLDVTNSEIKKVQKQKEIIANLEKELTRVKEEEFNQQIEKMIESDDGKADLEDLPEGVDSSMFLEHMLANVENLKSQVKKPEQKIAEIAQVEAPLSEPPQMTDEQKKAKMAELLGGLLKPKPQKQEQPAKEQDTKSVEVKQEEKPKQQEKPVPAESKKAVAPIVPIVAENKTATKTETQQKPVVAENKTATKTETQQKPVVAENKTAAKTETQQKPVVAPKVEEIKQESKIVEAKQITPEEKSVPADKKPTVTENKTPAIKSEVQEKPTEVPKVEESKKDNDCKKSQPTPNKKAEPKKDEGKKSPKQKPKDNTNKQVTVVDKASTQTPPVKQEIKVCPIKEKVEEVKQSKAEEVAKPIEKVQIPEPIVAPIVVEIKETPKLAQNEPIKNVEVEKTIAPVKQCEKVEPKPIESPAEDLNKQNKNNKKDSPKKGKGSPKNNKEHKPVENKESPKLTEKIEEKPVKIIEQVEKITEAPIAKPSLADILKQPAPIEEVKEVVPEIEKIETEVIKPVEITKPVEVTKPVEIAKPIENKSEVTQAKEEKIEPPQEKVIIPETIKIDKPIEKKEEVTAVVAEQDNNLTGSKNVERSDFASPANQGEVKSLKTEETTKPVLNQKEPAKKGQAKGNTAPQKGKAPQPKSNEVKKAQPPKAATPATKPPVEKEKPTAEQKSETSNTETKETASKPASQPVEVPKKVASTSRSPGPAKKPEVPPKPEHLKNGSGTKSQSPVSTPRKLSSENVAKPKSPSPPSLTKPVTKPTTPTSVKKPVVPPRPAHLKSSKPATASTTPKKPNTPATSTSKPNTTKTASDTTKTAPPKTANKQVSTPPTFFFRPQELLLENSEAFTEMDDNLLVINNSTDIPSPVSPTNSETSNQLTAFLTKDGIQILEPKTDVQAESSNLKFLSKEINAKSVERLAPCQAPIDLRNPLSISSIETDNDIESTYIEFKIAPRPIFSASCCQVCKICINNYYTCKKCLMVSYCKDEHLKIDFSNHQSLCIAIENIAKKRGGHVYNMTRNLNSEEFKNLKIHTINLCEKYLNRQLKHHEREIFLYPRICCEKTCREWKSELLSDCKNCRQVSHCSAHAIPENHKIWCQSYNLFQNIISRQATQDKIEPTMPQKVLKKQYKLTKSIEDLWKTIYRNTTAFQADICYYTTMTFISTSPLTALYGFQKTSLAFNEQFTIHLVGAELQFEGNILDKWETLFLHLVPEISDLHIILIGPELNAENLPVEIISRTRMCRQCRQQCRGVTFDFQSMKFYHDYCQSLSYSKPDMICFFNAGLHKTTSFKGFDCWPKTIEAALNTNVPVIVTSHSEAEAPLDLQRVIQTCTEQKIKIIQEPEKNPYASIRPERNFISEESAPLLFKNLYYFVVQKE